jgi:hypothetical protein
MTETPGCKFGRIVDEESAAVIMDYAIEHGVYECLDPEQMTRFGRHAFPDPQQRPAVS